MRRRTTGFIFFCLIGALAAALSPTVARAGSVLDSLQCDPKFVQIRTAVLQPQIANYPQQLVPVQQFNPEKGTLCMAVIRVTANYDALIQAENLSGSNAIITAGGSQTIYVQPPAFVAPLQTDTQILPLSSKPVGPYDGVIDFAGPSSASFTYKPINPRDIVLIDNVIRDKNDIGFDNFTGFGTYNFGVTGLAAFEVTSNTGAVVAKANLRVGTTIEVEYHYIPEPASLALLLPALLLVRRRRRHR